MTRHSIGQKEFLIAAPKSVEDRGTSVDGRGSYRGRSHLPIRNFLHSIGLHEIGQSLEGPQGNYHPVNAQG